MSFISYDDRKMEEHTSIYGDKMHILKRILKEKVVAFCEHCTLHGVYYLRRGRSARAAWGAIVVAGIALWGVLSHMIWQKYNIDPTVTVVESTYYRSEQIPFPAVMICDPLYVYGPKSSNITHILSSRGYDDVQIDEFYDSWTAIHSTTYVLQPYIRKMHSLLQDLGMTVDVLLEKLKKPCDIILVKCKWRSKQYNCSEMMREVVTVLGHCCQFDIGYFRRSAPKNTTFTPGITGSQGLELTVNGVKEYPNGTVRDGTLLLYLFDAANEITAMDNPISLAPSTYFDIDLEIYAIDSSAEVKALPLKIRKCAIPNDRGLGASFYQKCIESLMMRQVVNICRCLPFVYSAADLSVQDYPNCTFERYLCIHANWDSAHADMHSLIRTNACYQKCDYVEYDSKTDYIRRERAEARRENESYSILSIHYATSTCLKYRRELIYTWDQMLANLGGIFGLCLGGSIISIIEIIWFLIDLVVVCFYKNYSIEPKPKEKKIAFVLEKEVAYKDKNKDGCYKFVN